MQRFVGYHRRSGFPVSERGMGRKDGVGESEEAGNDDSEVLRAGEAEGGSEEEW